MEKEIFLGWQDTEKLKQEGRILEAFVILVNWVERNLQFPIYYYYVISKKDEQKQKEFLEKFESKKGKASRLSQEQLSYILSQEQSQQEKLKIWATLTRFWSSDSVWDDFKKALREVAKEFQFNDIDKLIGEIAEFREMRGKVIHRLIEDRVTKKEVQNYYDTGKELNQKIQQLHYKFLHRKE